MAGANMAGIINVFGEEVKSCIKSCELQFKKQRKKMAKNLTLKAQRFSEVSVIAFLKVKHWTLITRQNSNGPVHKQRGRKAILKILVDMVA